MAARKAGREQRLRKKRQRRAKRKEKSGFEYTEIRFPGMKMSDVISHVAEPLLAECDGSPEQIEQIIRVTILAWNLALLPKEELADARAKLFTKHFGRRRFGIFPKAPDPRGVEAFEEFCNIVARRKQQFYPLLNHVIVDCRFTRKEDGIRFDVIYSLTL